MADDERRDSYEPRRIPLARLGELLAEAEGFRVVARGGDRLGVLDHTRYRSRVDCPDEIVVMAGRWRWRRRAIVVPAELIGEVDRGSATVRLRITGARARGLLFRSDARADC